MDYLKSERFQAITMNGLEGKEAVTTLDQIIKSLSSNLYNIKEGIVIMVVVEEVDKHEY